MENFHSSFRRVGGLSPGTASERGRFGGLSPGTASEHGNFGGLSPGTASERGNVGSTSTGFAIFQEEEHYIPSKSTIPFPYDVACASS